MKPRLAVPNQWTGGPFSILERIDVGETPGRPAAGNALDSFSILERIDVGETFLFAGQTGSGKTFQYPRTDRRG